MPSIPEGWASLGSISFALAVLLGCRNSARFRYFIAISPSFIAFLDSTRLPPLLASVGRYGLLSLDGAPGGGRLWRVLERSTPERKKRAHNCLASRRGGSSFLTLARSRPLPRKNRTESFHVCLFSTFFSLHGILCTTIIIKHFEEGCIAELPLQQHIPSEAMLLFCCAWKQLLLTHVYGGGASSKSFLLRSSELANEVLGSVQATAASVFPVSFRNGKRIRSDVWKIGITPNREMESFRLVQ